MEWNQFFRNYVDPLKPEVAEWGAEVGYWAGNRAAALETLRKLADAAIAQAGLAASPRLEQRRARLHLLEALRDRSHQRIAAGIARLTGVKGRASSSRAGRVLENGVDIATVTVQPLFLLALAPIVGVARWRFERVEARENSLMALRAAAITNLTVWFERHADRGELAAGIRSGRTGRMAAPRRGPADGMPFTLAMTPGARSTGGSDDKRITR